MTTPNASSARNPIFFTTKHIKHVSGVMTWPDFRYSTTFLSRLLKIPRKFEDGPEKSSLQALKAEAAIAGGD